MLLDEHRSLSRAVIVLEHRQKEISQELGKLRLWEKFYP